MFARDLADVIRAAGLAVEEAPGWKTRGAKGLGLEGVDGVVWHHTGTPRSSSRDYPTYNVILNGRSDLPGPLAQLGIGYGGKVYVFCAGRANHAGKGRWPGLSGNLDCLGVEMESPGDGTWTAEQKRVMPILRDALSRAYGVPLGKHIAHREWAPARKDDPVGIDIRSMVNTGAASLDLAEGLAGDRVRQLQARLVEMGYRIAVDGDFGPATKAAVIAIQASAGLDQDGVVGPKTLTVIDAWQPDLKLDEVPNELGPIAQFGTTLRPGTTMTAPEGFQLRHQGDGNVVLYGPSKAPIWWTNARGDRFEVQDDGNLVLYRGDSAVWASNTAGRAASGELIVQGDGNLVLYGPGREVLWQSGTARELHAPVEPVRKLER